MQDNYTLMLENIPVLSISFSDMETFLWNRDLLPFSLREKIQQPASGNVKEFYRVMAQNILHIKDYASSRVLSLSRENAKQICTACGVSQDNGIENRVNICMSCKGISVNDAYWFKQDGSSDTWGSVNIRQNHLFEIVDVALGGKQPTLTTNQICPELTTKGLFKKAWIRENNDLVLLKSDRLKDFTNTKAEILTSKILDCTNIPHVKYLPTYYEDLLVAKCRNFVPEDQSFVEAHEIIAFCRDKQIDYMNFMLEKCDKDFANMAVMDYVLQNTDRHDQNYGVMMDNETGSIIGLCPLFDHNQALVADWLGKDVSNTLSQMLPEEHTLEETAQMLEAYAHIEWDRNKWENLKREYPAQSTLFENIEKRAEKFPCISFVESREQQYDIEEYIDRFPKPTNHIQEQRDVIH